MGAKADQDLWGQVLAIEARYGDRGPEVIARKIEEFRLAGDYSDSEFWTSVAECLTDLHAICYPGRIEPTSAKNPGFPVAPYREPARSAPRATE